MQKPAYHGRDHKPAGWTATDDPGGADPHSWLVEDATVPDTFLTYTGTRFTWGTPSASSSGGTYSDYTPGFTAIPTDPTLGAGDVVLGRYTQIGDLVHCYGRAELGSSGFNPGSGVWQLSLPVPFRVNNGIPTGTVNTFVGQAVIANGGDSSPFSSQIFYAVADNAGVVTKVKFLYPATWPFGDFAHMAGADWTTYSFVEGTQFDWSIVYEAA